MQPACIILSALLIPFATTSLINQNDFWIQAKDNWCRFSCNNNTLNSTECHKQCSKIYDSNAWNCDKTIKNFENCQDRKCSLKCPDDHLCCPSNRCGHSCHPLDPNSFPGAPEIPTNITVVKKLKTPSRITIHWLSYPKNDTVLYYVEERHNTGCKFVNYYMNEWSSLKRKEGKSWMTSVMTSFNVKPGTWYQFRVAAVNSHGTLGFSQPSEPFKSSAEPRRPASPNDLRFQPVKYVPKSKTVWGILSWTAPKSSLPIRKYTIFVNKRIAGEHTALDKGSILTQDMKVSGDKTNIKIKDLDPNLHYFFQVMAHAKCGPKELHSDTANLSEKNLLSFVKNASTEVVNKNIRKRGLSIKVGKVIKDPNGILSVKISWKERPESKYAVSWRSRDSINSRKPTITVKSNHVILPDLILEEKYDVTVTEITEGKKARRTGTASFLTSPECNKLKSSLC